MGFKLNVDLETSLGPTQELYVRVESFNFNKVTSEIGFQLTYWIDQKHAIRFNRIYLDEPIKNAVGLVQERILYFPTELSDGEEIQLEHYLTRQVGVEEEVDIPVFETVEIKKEVPYVSFDENGDEIELYRTVTETHQKEVGTKKEIRKVVKPEMLKDIYSFCYKEIKEYLAQWFPEDKIETVK